MPQDAIYYPNAPAFIGWRQVDPDIPIVYGMIVVCFKGHWYRLDACDPESCPENQLQGYVGKTGNQQWAENLHPSHGTWVLLERVAARRHRLHPLASMPHPFFTREET